MNRERLDDDEEKEVGQKKKGVKRNLPIPEVRAIIAVKAPPLKKVPVKTGNWNTIFVVGDLV